LLEAVAQVMEMALLQMVLAVLAQVAYFKVLLGLPQGLLTQLP
jgi:hypothetical protein